MIQIVLILMIMASFCAELLDVKSAFLYREFTEGEQLWMEIPQGMETYFPTNCILKLLKTIYGLKQAAYAFWRKLLKALIEMKYQRSKADPCLYFAWTMHGLKLWHPKQASSSDSCTSPFLFLQL